ETGNRQQATGTEESSGCRLPVAGCLLPVACFLLPHTSFDRAGEGNRGRHGRRMTEVLLDPSSIARGLRRVAGEIAERGHGASDLVLIGIRRGGEPVARRLAELIGTIESTTPPPVGSLDITLYRDDAATALPNPRIGPSHIPFEIGGRRVVLVDDVLYTGRTIRAAVDAILDYGRPRRIELA